MKNLITVHRIFLVAVITVGSILIVGSIPVVIFPDWSTRGQFGDSFGLLNAVASSLALVMVAITLRLQGQQLEIQRKELELTRAELARTAEAQESSASRLADQISHMTIASQINGLSTLLQSMDSEIAATAASYQTLPRSEAVFRGIGFASAQADRIKIRDAYRSRIHSLLGEVQSKTDTTS
jgi:hypothetical protein